MEQIYVISGGHEQSLRQALTGVLRQTVNVVPFLGQQEARFVLLPEDVPAEELADIPSGAAVVASSAEEKQLARLSGMAVRLIACGFGSKDTVTFSSRNRERAVISLLRPMERADGSVAEPMDWPLDSSGISDGYPLLAAAAAAIYCGKQNSRQN